MPSKGLSALHSSSVAFGFTLQNPWSSLPPKRLGLILLPGIRAHLPAGADGGRGRGRALEVKGFASPYPLPEPSFLAQNILSLGLQIFLLINYYASCQISIAITKRLIATMRCGTPLLQGNFLLFMLWHNIVQQSGRTTKHKFSHSPSAEEVILITAEG